MVLAITEPRYLKLMTVSSFCPFTLISVLMPLVLFEANGDPSVLDCPLTDTEDDYPILCKEVEAAVQLLKKETPAGIDNISAELVIVGGEDVITTLTMICNKIW